MSSATTRVNTGNQITTDYERAKIFLWNNRYESDSFVNNSNYTPLTLLAGTVMGRITNTNIMAPCLASAVDGSQIPRGVLAQDIVGLGAGQTKQCSICIGGDVASNKLIFFFSDTLETVVAGERYKDRIQAATTIILRSSTEMTDFDN